MSEVLIAPSQVTPNWEDEFMAMPDPVLRSALFAATERGRVSRKERQFMNVPVPALAGISIAYMGVGLTQSDLTVWGMVLHMYRGKAGGETLRFSAAEFLKQLGRDTGRSNRKWLYESLDRLSATHLKIHAPRGGFSGSLLGFSHDWEGSGTTPKERENLVPLNYSIAIHPDLILFFTTSWSKLYWQQRLQLKSALAKWLHGFYSTHANPYPMKVETIRELSGSKAQRASIFLAQVKDALKELKAVGMLESASIDTTGKVSVKKHPTESQKKYLSRLAGMDCEESAQPAKAPGGASRPKKPVRGGRFSAEALEGSSFDFDN